jgi:hypothetical protein
MVDEKQGSEDNDTPIVTHFHSLRGSWHAARSHGRYERKMSSHRQNARRVPAALLPEPALSFSYPAPRLALRP